MFSQTILIGRLGQDPEMRYTGSGRAISKFSLATWKKFTKDGETKEKTTWHNIVAWEKLAEICGQYLSKGKLVMIEGEIETESWEKDGKKHYRTFVRANTMKMLGQKSEGGAPESQDNYSGPNQAGGGEDDFPF